MAATWRGLTWDQIGAGLRAIHPNGPAVAAKARDAGKNPAEVCWIRLADAPRSALPILVFDDGTTVSMSGAGAA